MFHAPSKFPPAVVIAILVGTLLAGTASAEGTGTRWDDQVHAPVTHASFDDAVGLDWDLDCAECGLDELGGFTVRGTGQAKFLRNSYLPSIECQLDLEKGPLSLSILGNERGEGGYRFAFLEDQLRLVREGPPMGRLLCHKQLGLSGEHRVRVSSALAENGLRLSVFVDGELRMECVDPDPLRWTGSVAVHGMPPTRGRVDDFRVEAIGCRGFGFEPTAALPAGGVTSLAWDSGSQDVVYAATSTNSLGAWRSDDAGRTWARIYQWGMHNQVVEVDPDVPGCVLIGDNRGMIVRTTDRGFSWTEVFNKPPPPGEHHYAAKGPMPSRERHKNVPGSIQDIKFDPDVPGRVVAVTTHGWVLESPDRGQTWNDIARGLSTAWGVAMLGDRRVVIATDSGLFRSSDGGHNWVETPAQRGVALSVVGHLRKRGWALAATENGIFRTTDGGLTWELANSEGTSICAHKVAWCRDDPRKAVAATSSGVYVSGDSGKSWRHRSPGGMDIASVAIHDQDPGRLVAGGAQWWSTASNHEHPPEVFTEGPSLWTSFDGGQSWVDAGPTFREDDGYSVASDPSDPSRILTATMCSRGLFISDDDGASYVYAAGAESYPHYSMRMEVAPWDPDWIFLTSADGFQRSTDGGKSWEDLFVQRHFHGMAVEPRERTIYIGSATHMFLAVKGDSDYPGAHLFRSTDLGEQWEEICEGFPCGAENALKSIEIAPDDPMLLYAGASHEKHFEKGVGFFRSTNGGDLWTASNEGLPSPSIYEISIDPENPDRLYAGTAEGVARSEDRGLHWTAISDFHGYTVAALSGGWVAAGGDEGFYISSDRGTRWAPVARGLHGHPVREIDDVPERGVIRAALKGGGVRTLATTVLGLSLDEPRSLDGVSVHLSAWGVPREVDIYLASVAVDGRVTSLARKGDALVEGDGPALARISTEDLENGMKLIIPASAPSIRAWMVAPGADADGPGLGSGAELRFPPSK